MVNTHVHQAILDAQILIVDDVELYRVVLEKTLKDRGFKNITLALNGLEALEKAALMPPDMVILDIQMPVMDGLECCATLRSMHRHAMTPILVQTVLAQPEMRVKAFAHGATDVVSKPVDPDELYTRVMVHLENQYCLRELQAYQERTSMELDNARALQMAILPDAHDIREMQLRHGLDVAAHFKPSREIGGDFWGIKRLFPHQIAFWMVDFSGQGISAALNAFRLHAYLTDYSPHTSNPGEYLTAMNEKLLELLLVGQFATMFYGIIDTQGHQLIYASAGSPPPMVLRKKTGAAERIDSNGLPLGLSIHTYATQKVAFHPGDQIFWYSDAITETPRADGSYFTEDDLLRMLEANAGDSSAAFISNMVDAFEEATSAAASDDLTMVSCRW